MAALEIRLNDQNRERDAISPTTSTSTTTTTTTPMTTTTSRAFPTGGSRQFPATKIIYQTDEAVLTRQAALESRMNALESLFFASKGTTANLFLIFVTVESGRMIDALQP